VVVEAMVMEAEVIPGTVTENEVHPWTMGGDLPTEMAIIIGMHKDIQCLVPLPYNSQHQAYWRPEHHCAAMHEQLSAII
jgi:hypothetical protein